jgi:hypothetical protein
MTIVTIGIVSAVALVQIGAVRQSLNGDSGMRVLLAQMSLARETSIAERRTIQLQFVAPNTLQIIRNDVPAGTTMLSSVVFEGGVEYALTVLFNSDGTLVDERGRPINGTIFLAVRGGRARSVRAITVLGATGRIRVYRWSGAEWTRA